MSEKIFACLLRLYPSRFREKYTEEAIQLCRDLHRQETGLLRRTGLWIGLLADLAFGLPQAYRNTYVSTAASPVALAVQGVPTFRVLELKPLRPGSFLFGSILTLALLSAFSVVLRHLGAWGASGDSSSPIVAVMERLHQSMSSGQDGDESPQTDSSVPDDGRNGEARKAKSVTTHPAGVETQKAIHPNERRQVIPPSVESPDRHQPHPQPSKNAQEAMPQSEMHGVWVIAHEGTVSVPRMTPYLQPMTRDAQESNARNNIPIPSRDGTSAGIISPYRATTKQHDCTFETIEVLPHNIGYFKLDSFPDPAICGASTDEAMIRLNDTSAIIFDLRENRGGHPETAEQIATWLFERPAAWYNPGERSAAQSMTHSPVRNSRLGNKPVYILTSSRTVDGAEQFVYNLKMLKRATVIGERTRGETHSKPFYRNDDHLGIPMKSLTNSYGRSDWEGTGIAPDVEVKASDALQIAEESARAKIERK
jgi:hypothetical protein